MRSGFQDGEQKGRISGTRHAELLVPRMQKGNGERRTILKSILCVGIILFDLIDSLIT